MIEKKFRARLRSLRIGKKLSYRALSLRSGVPHTSLFQIETGLTDPCLSQLVKLARGLRVPFQTLMSFPPNSTDGVAPDAPASIPKPDVNSVGRDRKKARRPS